MTTKQQQSDSNGFMPYLEEVQEEDLLAASSLPFKELANPKSGMRVRVVQVLGTSGMLIAQRYLDARTAGVTGTLHGYVPGHGGDVWWMKHDDGTESAYSTRELEEI